MFYYLIFFRDVEELHRNMGVKHEHFDRFKKYLETILLDMNKERDLIDEVLKKVED
jgi:hypothetical protein